MIDAELHNALEAIRCTVNPCGSRVTCDPQPAYSDWDYLVHAPDMAAVSHVVTDVLPKAGFSWEGNAHYQNVAADGFMSWRKGDVNLIVTSNADFASRHRVATSLCKRLNLMDKQDRIALFQAVLYGTKESK